MSLTRKWIPSPCYSSRGGQAVRLIVVHTAEGARTIEDLGNFFANGANGVSSQVGADDKRGVIGEYVTRGNKAWTQGNANPVATSLELCGFASWSTAEWKNNHHAMLENCADWIAEEAKHFGLPITELGPSAAQGSGRGVCQHIDLGSWGGGHVDCGSGFPMGYVLDLARGKEPTPPAAEEDDDVFTLKFDSGGSAPLVFTNKQANGSHRVRVFSNRACKVEIDLRAETAKLSLGYDAGPQGMAIPKDVKCGVVRLVEPPSQGGSVSCTISD